MAVLRARQEEDIDGSSNHSTAHPGETQEDDNREEWIRGVISEIFRQTNGRNHVAGPGSYAGLTR